MPTPQILAGVARFQSRFAEKREAYERLATEGQAPQALFIACSDSRVAPEVLTGADMGDLFVVRTVGNLVPPYGLGELAIGAALEYVVLHLRVRHVVVCGHTDCGCMRALGVAPDWSREPHTARWIEHARTARTKVEAGGLPAEEQPLAMVRENVLLQLEHVRTYDPVREAERAGTLALHGWVYHVEDGSVEAYDPRAQAWTPLT